MSRFLDELDDIIGAKPPAPGPSTVDSNPLGTVDDVLGGQPQGPVEYNLIGLGRWVRNNPDKAAAMLVQGGASIVGAGVGAPAGPAGMMAGGAVGNLVGDIAGRAITGQETPTLTEGAVDLGLGALGPAVSQAPKGAARLLTGANAGVRRQAAQDAESVFRDKVKEAFREAEGMGASGLRASEADLDDLTTRMWRQFQQTGEVHSTWRGGEAAQRANKIALEASARQGARRADTVSDIMSLLPAAGHAFAGGDMGTTVAWLAGGMGANYARRTMANGLVNNPKIREWILREGVGPNQQGASAATTLAALGAQQWLTADEREAVAFLQRGGANERAAGGDIRERQRERAARMERDPGGRFTRLIGEALAGEDSE